MAPRRSATPAAGKTTSPRRPVPSAAVTHRPAHPRLVHGFLVHLPQCPGIAPGVGGPHRLPHGGPGMSARLRNSDSALPDAAHGEREGPADDAIFH